MVRNLVLWAIVDFFLLSILFVWTRIHLMEQWSFKQSHKLIMTVQFWMKSKDNLEARKDLKEMNIRQDLHPQEKPSGKFYLPPARFAMSKTERRAFCKVLQGIK